MIQQSELCLHIYPKELKLSKEIPIFPYSVQYYSQQPRYWKLPKCLSVNKWIKQMCYTYYSALKTKKETLPFATR